MLSLVIDIRSDVVEGTLVNFPEKSSSSDFVSPQIIYSASTHFPLKLHATSGERLTKMMLKSVEDLCGHISHEAVKFSKEKIGSVHYVLSSPWVISQSKTVKVQFENDTLITEGIIKNIIEEDRNALIENNEDDMIFIEQKIFAVELNGYPVQDYKGKVVKSLKVSFAFSLSSDRIIKKIREATSHIFHRHIEHFHSAILLHYLSSRVKILDDREYILVHVHGELTDIAVIKKGASAHIGSFPFGSSTLLRKVSHSFKDSLETAASTIALYEAGTLEKGQHKKVHDIVTPLMNGWYSGFSKSIELPPHIVSMSSGSPYLSLFKTTLEESGYKVEVDQMSLSQIYVAALRNILEA